MLKNIQRPAPKWYRIFNRIYGPTETTVLTAALILGYDGMTKEMLIFKLASSYIRTFLEAFLVENAAE
jgi:hypothetical protein